MPPITRQLGASNPYKRAPAKFKVAQSFKVFAAAAGHGLLNL